MLRGIVKPRLQPRDSNATQSGLIVMAESILIASGPPAIRLRLPLVLAFFDLHGANKSEPDGAALSELLVQELVADEPFLQCRPLCRQLTCAWLTGLRWNGQ